MNLYESKVGFRDFGATAEASEPVQGGVLLKKVLLKILQISQENTCVGAFS